MANDKSGKRSGWGPFERGAAYEEVGPGLGRLHDAWDVETGSPALQLLPTARVEWQPEGSWRVSLLCEPHPASVTLRVDEAPASVPVSELADMLVLTTAAFTRVEDNPRLRAHLASGLSLTPPTSRRSTGHPATNWMGLSLGLGFWLLTSLSAPAEETPEAFTQEDASALVDLDASDPVALTYPLPAKPFRNQAVPPCKTNKGAVEIKGGCWVALEQKPPCFSDQAEYQGKCYLPVARPQRLPQSAKP
ncbi:hypothetical protein D187_007421 [Cystobacter fuscus DSM 2262]|uniref:Protein kinase n=1 Tax=Cystobacter fuscus (strain ATCC 25194 / DSM 2262 / NBRC 100088 / M29) TaxID=1242864 RepID=S9Q450_CYSF2|nr:hypothetical protein [Cystobacter fuscus]EPX56079.1 hypothetical protein D187_007421 [Cystobacter fuscus DSM 2262]